MNTKCTRTDFVLKDFAVNQTLRISLKLVNTITARDLLLCFTQLCPVFHFQSSFFALERTMTSKLKQRRERVGEPLGIG